MNQSATVSNIYGVGVCNVSYNRTNLGATKGGVTVAITPLRYARTIDKYGETPTNIYDIGVNISVTTPLLEEAISMLDNFFVEGTANASKITFGRPVGTALTGYLLVIEPKDDSAHDIVIYSAIPRFDGSFVYTNDADRVYNVVWDGMIADGRSANDQLFKIEASYSWSVSKSSSSVSKP